MKTIIFLLSYVAIALLVFVNVTNSKNEQLTYMLQAQYSDKMTDASEKLTDLNEAVQKTIIFEDPKAVNRPLEDIWRLSSEIKGAIASLPLDQQFSNEWMNYLSRLGDYSKLTMNGQIPKDEWQGVMNNVIKNLNSFSSEWEVATTQFFQNDVQIDQWMHNVKDTQPTQNWQAMGNTLKTYSESDFPLTTSESDAKKKKELRHLDAEVLTQAEVIEKFKTIFPRHKDAKIHVTKSRPDAPYPFYHLEFQDGIKVGYADLTEKGGYLLSLLMEKPFEEKVVSIEKIKELAEHFKNASGYTDIELAEIRENHNVWHLSYVRIDPKTKAKVYADGIQMKVAKDNGDLLGLNAMEYIQKENLKEQPMKDIDWTTYFSKGTTVQEESLAYTENERMIQRLCYELIVTKDVEDQRFTYRLLIDTETEDVLKGELLH